MKCNGISASEYKELESKPDDIRDYDPLVL